MLRCCWAQCSNDLNNDNMLSSPKISQGLTLSHGWESLDTLGTARAWTQHVERCCASVLDFVEPRMNDRETRKMLSDAELKVWPVSNLTQQDSTPLNRVFMLRACTVDKSSAFARCFKFAFTCKGDYFGNLGDKTVAIREMFTFDSHPWLKKSLA